MKLSGLWVALLTPFEPDGAVDHGALRALVEDLVPRGVDGLVPLGSTGEFTELDADERAAVLRTVVQAAAGRVPVLAGVSDLSTRATCRNAVEAARAGADAVLVLPPLYWKLPDDGVFAHFTAVADATALPVVAYDFPALTGQPLSPALLGRLAAEEPRVIGVKLTVRDLDVVRKALAATRASRPDFSIVTGFEDLIPAAVWAGADGGISGLANVVPDELVAMVAALRAGRPDVAASIREVLRHFDAYDLTVPAIPGLKAVAAAVGRIPRATARLGSGASEATVVAAAARWVTRHQALVEPERVLAGQSARTP
ncbi:dihydrodipicolinate synthase family protein [Microlunatus antarcticus]